MNLFRLVCNQLIRENLGEKIISTVWVMMFNNITILIVAIALLSISWFNQLIYKNRISSILYIFSVVIIFTIYIQSIGSEEYFIPSSLFQVTDNDIFFIINFLSLIPFILNEITCIIKLNTSLFYIFISLFIYLLIYYYI